MRMQYGRYGLVGCVFAALALGALGGCDSDDDKVQLVLITGTVINIDTATAAKGVRVALLDSEFSAEVPTGDDGSFTIRVPEGSVLYLVTEDFNTATSDDWIPLINIDTPGVVASGPIENLLVHACPHSSGNATGSEAVWDSYLAGEDDANGDRFVPTVSDDSGGNVVLLAQSCNGTSFVSVDSLFVNFNNPLFPTAYFNSDELFASGLDTMVTPKAYPPDHGTDSSGWVMSFGDPSYGGGILTATITDMRASRDWIFGPAEIPVRPGTISLVWAVILDGVTGNSLQDLLPCLFANP
jgi:hypothetical protein